METKSDSLESLTISALISDDSNFQNVLPQFSILLKTNFENYNLWLRFGLVLTLKKLPRSALQAFNECLRIDQHDPLPAMLAAKLMLQDLDDPENGLEFVDEAIKRCQKIDELDNNNCHQQRAHILSKCYLLAGIMHAHIYEKETESIKEIKLSHLKSSLNYLDLASKTYSNDYLIHFHHALYNAKQKSYSTAIDNLRQAISLNPNHVPSIQLLILSLSALKLFDKALILCESTLHEFEDNLLLLYIKCNLEQCLVEKKGYKSALNTAQYMLKCIRRSTLETDTTNNQTNATTSVKGDANQQQQNANENKQATNLFSDDISDRNEQNIMSGELSVWLLVAEIFIKIGSISDAELCADESASHVKGALSYQIMFVRGLIAKAKNNLIEAKSFFQSCLALNPRHAKALQQMAHVHHLLGNYSTAEKFLKDSLDVDSECHKTWYYLSLVFIETNQHDRANECVKKATILEESSPVIPISAISRLTLE